MPEGTEQHWTETSENAALQTPEAKTILSKFATSDDCAIGYMELQKAAGKPFKLPESLDKLDSDKTKNDAMRREFSTKAKSLLGIQPVEKEEDLKDVNFSAGMAGEKPVADANLVKAFSKFVIDNEMPKGTAQKGIEFWNTMQAQGAQQVEVMFKENCDKVHAELMKANGNSAEKVAERSEKVKRMFLSHATADKHEDIGRALVGAGFTTSSALTLALMDIADKFSEGSTETGDGGKQKEVHKEPTIQEELPKTAAALGWKK